MGAVVGVVPAAGVDVVGAAAGAAVELGVDELDDELELLELVFTCWTT